MAAFVNFTSSYVIEENKQSLREARQSVLDKVKKKYDQSEKRAREAKLRGEDTWMLSSVDKRIMSEQQEHEKTKQRHKKEKKEKKKKKHKKDKKRDLSSDSDADCDTEQLWVEKSSSSSTPDQQLQVKPVIGPTLQRDSWMECPLDVLPTTSKQEIRDRQKLELEMKKKAEAEKIGQHKRELNPYWKDGGVGLPEDDVKPSKSAKLLVGVGDSGLSWLRKAYERCKQQAADEGRSMEEVASERFGSLKKLEKMLAKADKSERRSKYDKVSRRPRDNNTNQHSSRSPDRDMSRSNRGQYRRSSSPVDRSCRTENYSSRNEYNEESDDRRRENSGKKRFMKPGESDRYVSESSSKDREGEKRFIQPGESDSNVNESSSKDREGEKRFIKPGESDSNVNESSSKDKEGEKRFIKPGESDSNVNESSSKDRKGEKRFIKPGESDSNVNESSSKDRKGEKRFVKPGESDRYLWKDREGQRRFIKPEESERSRSDNSRHVDSGGRRFAKPGNMPESSSRSRSRSHCDSRREEPRWKRPGFRKPAEDMQVIHDERNQSCDRDSREKQRSNRRSRSSSTSSSPSSSSSDADDDDDVDVDVDAVSTQPPVIVLSELEMNELGAKILRAEIMGDESLAQELKSRLEEARKVKESQPETMLTPVNTEDASEEVLLTRTGRGGVILPLPDRKHEPEQRGRKRRKKEKVSTHEAGERVRYFDDDDKFSLKSLVEREKMGTAEDQNSMFARLAGRVSEKTDDDYQMDDVVITKAALKQSEAQMEERDRAKAIYEHRQMSGAMEKCHYCFNKVPKHLIIAIGTKTYLCLPNYRSLTPGHCLIVPMQHVLSGTSVDEDIWQEIQTFRKTLVRMFESQDQDVVFMETSMHLKKHPHMTVECVPMEKETGDLAPIYFKKAIQDSESEWSQNKKVVDLSRKDVRHAIPKGFPYFSVDFGLQGGFAHVIEEEHKFPSYFGKEIIGGMIDAEPQLWRKPHRESFDDQRRKVLEFADWWKPFDWTQNLQSTE